jgi:hypothetical protein
LLKKTITYNDFNGVETTGDFYFNLTKQEAVLLEIARDGGSTLSESLQALIESKSNKQLMKEFKEIIRLAYGTRSLDGKLFFKGDDQEEAKKFEATGAYHNLMLELISDATAAAHFINGIVPEDMSMDPEKLVAESKVAKTARQLSEEKMQGYQRKQTAPATSSQIVPDLPTTYGEQVAQQAPIQGEVVSTPNEAPQVYDVNSLYPTPMQAPITYTEPPAVQVDPRVEVNQQLAQQYTQQQQQSHPRH